MAVRSMAGARIPIVLALFLAAAVRLGADDHFRTGGQAQVPFPVDASQIIKSDQRFHVGDSATLSPTHMFVSCNAGDTINPGTIDIDIPVGLNMEWDTTRTPTLTWTGGGGSKVSFNGYFNASKTLRINVLTTFTPTTDNFQITNFGFRNFSATSDPISLTETTVNGVFSLVHVDDATCRIARPPSVFASTADQSFSAGSPPVAMNPIVLTESSVGTNRGIWAAHGIEITIPPGLNMTWNVADTVASCSGTAVPTKIAAAPTVSYSNGNKTVLIPVGQDFLASESVTISGLSFANFGADSSGSLTLNLGNTAGSVFTHATDGTTKTILGLPTILSASNQVFSVGDPPTNSVSIRVQESPGSPKINTTDDILITIPANLNLVFDQSITSVGCSGSAVTSGHMLNPTNGVTYPGGTGKQVLIPVNSAFASNRLVDITGLRFMDFTDANPSRFLTLEVSSVTPGIEDTDNSSIRIGKPTISSLGEQVFTVGVSPVAMSPLTLTDDPATPRIFNGTQIRIVIPAAFNMTWEGGASITPVTGLNTAVSYANGNKTLIVTANAGWTGSATISGLNFVGFATPSAPDNLELWMSGAAGASATNFDDKLIAIGGIPSMTSTSDQRFTVGDAVTAAAANTVITDSAFPSLQNGRTLQLVIPASLNMTFDTVLPLPTGVPGAGTGTVGALSFFNNRTLNIPITADFAGNQTLSINGLRFANFSGASQPQGLQLRLTAGGPVATTDAARKSIGAPTLSSAVNQVFGVLDPDTAAATITITDDNAAPIATPRIRNGRDIRIRIPAGFLMQWDTAVVPTVNVGAGTGTITAVDFPSNQILRLIVGLDFSAGQTVTVSGAMFRNFSGLSALDNLELDVNNGGLGTINALDNRTIKIGTRPSIVDVRTLDSNGNGSIDRLIVRYTEDINGATTSVTKGTGFIIGGGTYTIALGVQDPFNFDVVTYTLVEKGLPDTGTVPAVRYVGNAGNLTDVDDGLRMSTITVPALSVFDQAAPVIVGVQSFDDDGNGRLDRVVFTFSENLNPTQADIQDWTLIDADGTTNLLLGLTNTEVVILNNTVTLTLADNTGTAADPRYRYQSNGLGGTLADIPGNLVAVSTNNHAPIANAGSDQTLPPTRVTLNGGASFDADGQNLSFAWSQTGGGSSVSLIDPGTATPSFVTVVPDTYTFQLTVSDGITATSDSVSITILNVAPTAVVVVNQVGSNTVTPVIVGSLSSDINGSGDLDAYAWAQVFPVLPLPPTPPPAGTPTLLTPTGDRTDVSGAAPGAYVFELTRTDFGGNSAKSRVNVRVHGPGNFVPTANAGPDQIKAVGSTVTLDGRLSSTPGPNTLNYLWSPSLLFPGQQNSATPSFVPTGPGLYTFQLVVTDSVGGLASLPDSVTVLVHDPANEPPVAVAHKLSPSGNPKIGESVTLDSTGSVDPEGQPLLFAWRQTAGPAAYLSNPALPKPVFTPALSGTYEFELVVYDGIHISLPSLCRFQVLPQTPGVLPVSVDASFTGTTLGNGHISAGTVVTLTGTATGGASDVYWEQLDGPAVLMSSASIYNWYGVTVTFTPPVAGRYVFRVHALSFSTLLLDSDDVEVIVDDANVAPTANAGLAPTGMSAGDRITLNGSLSSDDTTTFGAGLTPYWRQVSGIPVELIDANGPQPSFVPPSGGVYIFELIVNDGKASSARSVVEVDVDPAPQAQASGGSGGGGCGLLGLEPLLLLGLAALAGRARRR